jgi:hypothetical protein
MERATNISEEYVRKQVQKITKIYLHSGDAGDASGGMEIASVNIHTARLIREAVAAVNRAEEEADKGEVPEYSMTQHRDNLGRHESGIAHRLTPCT